MHSLDWQPYTPKAIYYEASDSLEYVRRDDPAVYRRVDEYLTLVLDLHSRTLLGVKLKGFRHLCLTQLSSKHISSKHFISLIAVLEDAMSAGGDAIFKEAERKSAYRDALEIAEQDNVKLEEFPRQASC